MSAQSDANLFRVIKPPTQLSLAQKEMISKIEKYPNVKNVTYVKVNDYNTFIKEGHISFKIPNSVKTAKAKIKKRERSKDGGYNFYGVMESPNEGFLGDLQLIKENDLVFGTMAFEDKTYRIYGINKNVSAILSFDKSNSKRGCGSESNDIEPTPNIPKDNTIEPNRINTCQEPRIRTLCLFTTQANNFDPNIAQTATASINQFNNALSNSGVTNSEAQMVLSDLRLLPNFNEVSNNINDDINRLTVNAIANQFRNETASDMVILFTDGNYGGDQIEGTVANGAIPAENISSYAIVEAETAVSAPELTFIHEIGHLFGGRHNDDPGGPAYSHGSFFSINLGFFNFNCVDVMHNILSNAASLPIYSNPNISIFGTPTGNASCCNVARRITETSPNIALFRASPNILTTNILGQNSINAYGSFFYEPDITCGNGPYTTTWEVSFNNQSFTEVVANDGQLQLNISPGSASIFGSSVDIRMTVTSSDGQSSVSFLTVFIDIFGSPLLRSPNTSTPSGTNLLELYPNPANSKINLDYILENDTDVDIQIFDSQGRVVRTLKFLNQSQGNYQNTLDVNALNVGIYLCQIRTATSTTTKKFLVAR